MGNTSSKGLIYYSSTIHCNYLEQQQKEYVGVLFGKLGNYNLES